MIRSPVVHGKPESKVEVTVIEGPIPAHTELVAAHQPFHCLGVKGFSEELKVILLFLLPD